MGQLELSPRWGRGAHTIGPQEEESSEEGGTSGEGCAYPGANDIALTPPTFRERFDNPTWQAEGGEGDGAFYTPEGQCTLASTAGGRHTPPQSHMLEKGARRVVREEPYFVRYMKQADLEYDDALDSESDQGQEELHGVFMSHCMPVTIETTGERKGASGRVPHWTSLCLVSASRSTITEFFRSARMYVGMLSEGAVGSSPREIMGQVLERMEPGTRAHTVLQQHTAQIMAVGEGMGNLSLKEKAALAVRKMEQLVLDHTVNTRAARMAEWKQFQVADPKVAYEAMTTSSHCSRSSGLCTMPSR